MCASQNARICAWKTIAGSLSPYTGRGLCHLPFDFSFIYEKIIHKEHILMNFQLPGDIARQQQYSKVANIALSEIFSRFWNFQKRELISPISIVRCSTLIHIGKITQSSICDKLETCFMVLTPGTCNCTCSNC